MIRYRWGVPLLLAAFIPLAWFLVVPHMESRSPGTLDDVVSLLILTTMIPTNLFVLYYARANWRASAVGRALMVKATGVAILVDQAALTRLLGYEYPGYGVIRVAVYGFLAAGLWYQFLVLLQTRRAFVRGQEPHAESGVKR